MSAPAVADSPPRSVALTIPAHRMAELATLYLTSGLSAAEFGRRNGLSTPQTWRLSAMAKQAATPPEETLAQAGALMVSVSGKVLKTVERIAIKSQLALEAAADGWQDGTIPDVQTLKRIQALAALLTLPLRFQRPPGKGDDGSTPALPASSGSISV